eukprot:g497.t1
MRRAAIRRTVNPVNLDDVRASIEQQAACQVELCQALRALSGELRSRFGIFTAAASEEVLNELEKRACGLGVSDQEELEHCFQMVKSVHPMSPVLQTAEALCKADMLGIMG